MAGFSLGGGHTHRGGGGGDDEEEEGIPPESLFLYGTGSAGAGTSATSRGFELWQQHHLQRHHHQQHQQQQQHLYPSTAMLGFSSDESSRHHHLIASSSAGRGAMRGSSSSGGGGSGSMSCQDCGNQAKKDCSHMRCRTCCKSRGFQCPTHVRSTWVPASKRRERQQQQLLTASQQQQQQQQPAPRIAEPSKRPRELSTRLPTAIATTTSGGMEALNFPAEVSSPAVFRCVRVSPMDEADDEYAYQTAVSIGGHVFKGLLYDQGPEAHYAQQQQQLHLGDSSSSSAAAAASTAIGAGSSTAAAVSAGLIDPSTLYPTPLSAFVAGTQFFPHHPRP